MRHLPHFNDERPFGEADIELFETELARGAPPTQQLAVFLTAAYVYQRETTGIREFSPLFDFCRLAKRHPDLISASPEYALKLFEWWLRLLRRPQRSDPWRYWFEDAGTPEDARMEVVHVWENIRFVHGYTPLQYAVEKAKALPLSLKDAVTPGYALFVGTAYWLQKNVGVGRGNVILLPCHDLAALLGCTAMTVSRYRKRAVQQRLLIVAKKHRYAPSAGVGEATEFRFNFRRLTELTDWEMEFAGDDASGTDTG